MGGQVVSGSLFLLHKSYGGIFCLINRMGGEGLPMRSRSVPLFRFGPTFLNIQLHAKFNEHCKVRAKVPIAALPRRALCRPYYKA